MMNKLIKLLIIGSLVWSGHSLASILTPEQQAKHQGAILYQQGLCKKTMLLLE